MEKKDNRIKLDTTNSYLADELSAQFNIPTQDLIHRSLLDFEQSMMPTDIPPSAIHYIVDVKKYMDMILDCISGCIKDKNLSAEKMLKDYNDALSSANDKINTQSDVIQNNENTIADLNDEINTLNKRISDLEQLLSSQAEELKSRREIDELKAQINRYFAGQDANQQKQ